MLKPMKKNKKYICWLAVTGGGTVRNRRAVIGTVCNIHHKIIKSISESVRVDSFYCFCSNRYLWDLV